MIGRETIVNAISLLLIGTPIWIYSWRLLQDGLADSAERDSYLRLGILYLLSLGGVIIVLTAGGNLLYMILMRFLLGDGKTWIGIHAGHRRSDFHWRAVRSHLGILWKLAEPSIRIRREPRAALASRDCISTSSPSLDWRRRSLRSPPCCPLSLTFSRILPISAEADSTLHFRAALAFLAVGLPLWLMTWHPMQAQALLEGDEGNHARRSVIRKTYLYLVLFAAVIGGMVSAGGLVFTLINAALGGSTSDFAKSVLNSLQIFALFVVLLLYHLSALRKDGAARAEALEEKQSQFKVLVFDHDGKFGESVKAAFAKRAPNLPVTVVNANETIPSDVKADAIVLPASLAVDLPEQAGAWIKSFGGNRLIVNDEAAGVLWMNDFGQAADSAKAMAEGQEVRPQSPRMTSVWTYVAYVFAALFACQLLFMLAMLGVSMVTGF
jgi:hypothetical protein